MKYKIIVMLFLLIGFGAAQKSLAQTPTWQWAKGSGSTGDEAAVSSVIDASGNLYVVGWYTSANITFGSITLTNPGVATADVFLVKYDASGNALWAKTFGGIDGDLGNAIAIDPAGNIYITGWFTSANLVMDSYTLTNSTAGTSDVFVAKLNSNGTTLWAKSAGGALSDRGHGIAVDGTGNVFVTGVFGSTSINFGTGALTNIASGTTDFFIVKYNTSGTAQWSKSCGGTGADTGLSAATDSIGNVYVTGAYASSAINFGTGSLTNAAAGTRDLFVVKYDGLGTAAWSARSGGSLDDIGNAIAVRKNAVYITGAFSSASLAFGTTTLTNASAGTNDILLTKYDLAGSVLWAKKSGGTDSEEGNGLAIDSFGNVYLTGYFSSSSIAFGTTTLNVFSVGYRDLYIVSHDGSGNALWAIQTGSTYDETANCISVNSTGIDIYSGGSYNSGSVGFGAHTVLKGCGNDVYVAKLQGPLVGIKEENITNQLMLYPNPSSGKFNVDAEGQIIFYNNLGEMMFTQKLKGKHQFDFSTQPKGTYIYKVITDKKITYTGRVVVN
jgi:Secretion system C-terminal sorting domain/Beta-propeller repeat